MEREESQALGGLIALFVITSAWWALALWPVADGPAWLARTRYVCFGVTSTGLPDMGGWIGLIAGPLGMLSILVAGWSGGMRVLVRRARRSRTVAATMITLAFGCVLLVAGAVLRVQQVRAATAWEEGPDSVPPTSYPRLDRPAPPLSLTAQSGETVDVGTLTGRLVLVTFAYAHCTTICPTIVMHALGAQHQLRGTAFEPAVVIVTLDPWRDPPSRLPAMAKSWNLPTTDAWVLSGTVAEVEGVLEGWDVPRKRDTTTGEVTHPSLLYILDRNGRIAYVSTGGVGALVSLLRRL